MKQCEFSCTGFCLLEDGSPCDYECAFEKPAIKIGVWEYDDISYDVPATCVKASAVAPQAFVEVNGDEATSTTSTTTGIGDTTDTTDTTDIDDHTSDTTDTTDTTDTGASSLLSETSTSKKLKRENPQAKKSSTTWSSIQEMFRSLVGGTRHALKLY